MPRLPVLGALSLTLALCVTALGTPAAWADEAAWRAEFEAAIRPILANRCVGCHGSQEAQAELNLERIRDGQRAFDKVLLWESLAKRVQAGEMPPEGADPLTNEEQQQLLAWAARAPKPSDDCRQLATDDTQRWYRGFVTSRRLTRTEYNYIIRDLIGLDLRPADAFPTDGAGGEGFDTAGDTLFTSAILLEKYLAAAEQVIETAAPDATDGWPTEIAAARQRLLFVEPSAEVSEEEAARRIVARFARRAFRRPLADAELDRYAQLYAAERAAGAAHVAAVRHALKAVLLSPNFLFLVEAEPEKDGVVRLNPHQLAARLAIFLWSSLPDEELDRLADSGELHDNDVLRRQVRRMLADPRAAALGENFAVQWLGLGALGGSVRPDGELFPEFDDDLAAAMRSETTRLAAHVFQANRSLLELLDADYTFLNERLARLYGVAGVEGDAWRQVALVDRQRGGLLTTAGVLTLTSYPRRTSPVLRGRWVLEEVLGGKVPPPPPNVPSLEDDPGDETLSLRERLERHRTDPTCAACHARMDPLGFGLENFDVLGRWRDGDGAAPIDAAGKLPSGESFTGPVELKDVLLKRKDEFLKNLSRKLLGYALGRSLNKFDDCVIDDALTALRADDYRSRALVEQIVLSYPFQHRYFKR